MDDCCASMVKYFMFFINFIFAIAGIVLIGIGAYIQIKATEYLDFLSDNYLNTPIFIIIIGCVIFVIAFFGCCGAWNESACMVYTYSALLTVILIAELGAAIAAFALKGDLKSVIEDKMVEGMDNYGKEGYEGVTNAWDVVQTDLHCCGSTDYTDWFKNSTQTVPDSCCLVDTKGCGSNPDKSQIYTKGCLTEFEDQFVGNIGLVGGIALGVAAFQFLGIIFSCCLGRRIRQGAYYA